MIEIEADASDPRIFSSPDAGHGSHVLGFRKFVGTEEEEIVFVFYEDFDRMLANERNATMRIQKKNSRSMWPAATPTIL